MGPFLEIVVYVFDSRVSHEQSICVRKALGPRFEKESNQARLVKFISS